ncbi:MAG: dipeptide epimerase [Planctomycetota bacterium]|jgi:L-alanine-DL-glutamate epimerase-like enolase superfamily enzyme
MRFQPEDLKLILQHPFETAHGRVSSRTSIVLRIEDDGLEGIGEAPACDYLKQDHKRAKSALRKMEPLVLPDALQLEETLGTIAARFPDDPSAAAAVDIALHDLAGKKLGVPLYKFFGLSAGEARKTSFTIGIDSPDKVADKVEEAKEYSILKVKLGGPDDMEIMRLVSEATKATVRVDANCGWTFEEAVDRMKALAEMGVEFVEQPLAREDLEGHRRLREMNILPIMLDESVQNSRDIPAAAAACDGINIKLAKCGGLREAYRMIAVARAFDLKVMLGCMVESSIGITAAAHLSPLADYLDLDGNLLVANDPYRGVISAFGEMLLPDRPGLGLVDAYEARDWHD